MSSIAASYLVVDTDVFSFMWQNLPQGAPYAPYFQGVVPVLSFAVVAEVHFGAISSNWGERKMKQLEAAMRPYVVAPYAPQMAKLWGSLKAKARKSGHPLGANEQANDLWVAATAIFYDAPLATHNRRHFEGCPGLRLIEP